VLNKGNITNRGSLLFLYLATSYLLTVFYTPWFVISTCGPISNSIYYHRCLTNFESVAYLVFIFSEAFVLASRVLIMLMCAIFVCQYYFRISCFT